jgi:cellulose synthase/poly-beta-1,6-N-acetylglucosamine synthase-like glycosyltransferase
MTAVFCFFAALLVLSSVKSLVDGLAYLRYFRAEMSRRTESSFCPHVSVIVPCRGVDPGLRENLAALLHLDYPSYEVIFVTDNADDPAVAVIHDVVAAEAAGSASWKLVIAPAAKLSSQKVENLREAVLHASGAAEVYAFVDSDARVSRDWLRALVAPLADASIGAATGYRWFISESVGLASELRSVWNASIASALGPNTATNFCWGGSTAIRRATFDRLHIRERWSGTLSDDFVVTRTLIEAGLDIVFVPGAMAATVESCTIIDLFEFTTRQMKITRVYMPRLWILTLIGSILYVGVMAAAIGNALLSPGSLGGIAALVTLGLVVALGTGKAYVRLKAVMLAFPDRRDALRKQFLPQLILWSVTPVIFLINSLAAAFSRRIRWRSTTYELKSPTETVIIAD